MTTKIKKFRAADMSEASVTLKIFADASHGLHNVWRYLPAGMDIAPDCWRFLERDNAERQFAQVCLQLEARGFKCVSEATI